MLLNISRKSHLRTTIVSFHEILNLFSSPWMQWSAFCSDRSPKGFSNCSWRNQTTIKPLFHHLSHREIHKSVCLHLKHLLNCHFDCWEIFGFCQTQSLLWQLQKNKIDNCCSYHFSIHLQCSRYFLKFNFVTYYRIRFY